MREFLTKRVAMPVWALVLAGLAVLVLLAVVSDTERGFVAGDGTTPTTFEVGEGSPDDEETTTTTVGTTTTTASQLGSRESPFPINTDATASDQWRLKVLSTIPNATAAVLRENQFNDPPAPGHQFFIARVAATYLGAGSTSVLSQLTFKALDNENVTYGEGECGVIPDDLPPNEVFTNGTVTGNVCWEVKSANVNSLVMIVDIGFRTRGFFALR